MALAASGRALLGGLAFAGEPSTLEGQACGHTHIRRNVVLAPGIGDTADDNHLARANVATVASTPAAVDYLLGLADGTTSLAYKPKVGQTLVHPSEGSFRLDRLHDDNGVTRQFVVVQL